MFGDRLRLARRRAGFSLRELSQALDGTVTAQAIGKYERGEMMPSSGVLLGLTKALGVSIEYLLSEQVEKLEAVEFRKLSGTSVRERSRVEAEVIDHLQRYLAIEEILGTDDLAWQSPFAASGDKVGSDDDVERLAEKLRETWQLGVDPIPDMTALLEDHGIRVLILPLPERVSGLTCLVRRPRHDPRIPVIVVNRRHSLERRRLTLGHELAHRIIRADASDDREKASNFFAGAFLVSRRHLVREIGERRRALGYRELIQLKHMYRVSAAALLVRLRQVGIISESTLRRAFRTLARGWRKHEPEPLEDPNEGAALESPRRFDRLCYRALAERLITPVRAGELLRQPLAEVEAILKGPGGGNAHRTGRTQGLRPRS